MISRDATSSGKTTGQTSVTVSHTCSGSDRLLLVGVADQGGDTVTGVTYNGVAMTQIAKKIRGAIEYGYVYALLAPATGTHNVVVSRSNSSFDLAAMCASYNDVQQGGFTTGDGFDKVTNNASSTQNATATITTLNAYAWTFLLFSNGGQSAISAGSGSYDLSVGQAGGAIYDSNAPINTPASHSMSVNTGSADDWYTIIVTFAPIHGPNTSNAFFAAV